MNQQYSRNGRSSGISSLLRLLGAIFALVLIIGALDRAGVSVVLDKEKPQEPIAESRMYSYDNQEPENHVQLPAPSTSKPTYDRPRKLREASSRYQPNPAEWVERFAATARKQALEKGVPAGVALAVGLEKVRNGERLDSWDAFVNEVIEPLARLKQEVPKDVLRTYFKYSANSQRWVEGLSRYASYTEERLLSHLETFNLEAQDEQVTAIILQSPQTEERSGRVADEVVSKMVSDRNQRTRSSATEEQPAEQQQEEGIEEWEAFYEEEVGREVAREIARKKLRSGQYISEDDMDSLVEETNRETGEAMEQDIGLLGRQINRNHPEAEEMLDITKGRNAQARQELYQKKLREKRYAKGNR